MNLSIIIPVYNEEKSLKTIIKGVKKSVKIRGVNAKIIAVEDGSTDKSFDILKNIKEISVIQHSENKGYGASLKAGIKRSSYDWILILDADATYPPSEIPKLINCAKGEKVDQVIGERPLGGKAMPFVRKPAKSFLNWFASYLTGYHIPDLNSGMRLFKREIFDNYEYLFPQKFSFTSTLTMTSLLHSYKTKFVPITYKKRVGQSTVTTMDFPRFLQLLLKLSLFFKPIKVFAPLSLIILISSLIIPVLFVTGVTPRLLDTSFIILVSTALQTFFFGLLAEIIIHNKN